MKDLKYVITANAAVVIVGGKVKNIPSSHPNFHILVEVLRSGAPHQEKLGAIEALTDLAGEIESYCEGRLTIKQGAMYYKDKVIYGQLVDRILKMREAGAPAQHLLNFLDNLLTNPSEESRKDLYRFLEKNNLPITSDGHFLAYKKINDDYTDLRSGTFDNSIGAVVKMDRAKVDPDRNQTCSSGLHAASLSYMQHYGTAPSTKIIIVKINPADVVSVPVDYDDAKLRCCQYEVIAEMEDKESVKLRDYAVEDDEDLFTERKDEEPEFVDAFDDDDEFLYDDYDGEYDEEVEELEELEADNIVYNKYVRWSSSSVLKEGFVVASVDSHRSAKEVLEAAEALDPNLSKVRKAVFNKAKDVSSVDRLLVMVTRIDANEVTPIFYLPQKGVVEVFE